MKLIFAIPHLMLLTGAGKVLMAYANKFAEIGHDVSIVTQKINRKNFKFNEKIVLFEVGGPLPSNPFYWINFINIKKKYLKILNKLDCDFLISMLFPSNYICSKVNKNRYTKHLYYCFEPYRLFHDGEYIKNAPFVLKKFSWISSFFFKSLDIKGAKSADEIICISRYIQKRVREVYYRNSFLHYIGVYIYSDSDHIYNHKLNHKINKNRPYIFTLGLSHHMKGVRELMIIFQKILKKKPNSILTIAGRISKDNKSLILKMIKKLKIPQNNIIFHGIIDDSKLNSFFSKSSVTIYTSIDESYGLIPIESMLNGTPVVAFKNAGPAETILDGNTGFLIKDFDLNDFARKVIKIIEDENLYRKLSKNGINHVRDNFNFDQSFIELENMFKNFLH